MFNIKNIFEKILLCFQVLVILFNGISNLVGYLMTNPVYTLTNNL